jgi:hypothetical protein
MSSTSSIVACETDARVCSLSLSVCVCVCSGAWVVGLSAGGALCRWRMADCVSGGATAAAPWLCDRAAPPGAAPPALALSHDGRHALLAGGAGLRGARVIDMGTTAPTSASATVVLDWADAPAPRRAGRVCAAAWARGGAFATGDECGGVLLWGRDAGARAAHLAAEAEAAAL